MSEKDDFEAWSREFLELPDVVGFDPEFGPLRRSTISGDIEPDEDGQNEN